MLLGIDTSRWEDNPATPQTINWQAAKDNGVAYVILKATEGTSYVDPVFALHKANSAGILPRGSYHFWRYGMDWKMQVENYAKVAKGLELPPCLDVEDWYGELPKGNALAIALEVMLRGIDAAFGRECMIYTSPNILRYYLPPILSNEIMKRKLWIANYGVSQPNISPFSRYTFWQFSDKGDAARYGISEASGVDLNWYPGTQADFDKEFGLSIITPPEAGPVVTLERITVGGIEPPELLKVEGRINGGPVIIWDVDQRAVVSPPPAVDLNLYRVAAELWPLNHGGASSPAGGGPLTQTLSTTAKKAYFETSLSADWVKFIASFNTAATMAKITATNFGPSKGFNGAGKLRYIGLVWPSGPGVNVVKVTEISGLWARIVGIPMGSGPDSFFTPASHPWLFHKVCDARGNPVLVQGAPIICPILGDSLWVPLSALVKL